MPRAALLVAPLLILAAAIPFAAQDRGGLFGPPDEGGRDRDPGLDGDDEDEGPTRDPREISEEVLELGKTYFGIADYNGDEWISYREGKASLGLDRDRFARVDRDRDGRVDWPEFQELFTITIRSVGDFPSPKPDPSGGPVEIPEFDSDALDGDADFEPAESIVELFGTAVPREEEDAAVRRPARIAGPIPHFRRLDLDLDGEITEADLDALLRPMQVSTRLSAVIAIMDRDESGGVTRAEFDAMMSDAE